MTGHEALLGTMITQGFSQLQEGKFEDAVETFSACHAIELGDDRPLRGRGLAFIQIGNPKAAEADFLSALNINRREPENLMGLGVSLAMQNKIYEGIKAFEELLALSPDYVPGYIQLGRLQLKIGAITKGRDYFKQALMHKPSLEQRRMIEAVLKEQDKLDAGRYYRPDFDKLSKAETPNAFFVKIFKSIFGDPKKKAEKSEV